MEMKVFTTPEELQAWSRRQRQGGRVVALVPTMGALHEGHLSLIEAARRKFADEIIVSVFVNPAQFGPNEDFASYPRTQAADAAKCRAAGATAVFFPTPETMYLPDHSVWMNEEKLSATLCGARRPGHFRGVCTVVAKLFNITHPNFAFFGRKDFQQAAIIKRMVRDMNYDVQVVVCPVVREESGLALSSRNEYLTPEEKANAVALSHALKTARWEVRERGTADWRTLRPKLEKVLTDAGLAVDYIEAVEAETLEPVETLAKGNVVLLAAYCGKTRLIDNAVM